MPLSLNQYLINQINNLSGQDTITYDGVTVAAGYLTSYEIYVDEVLQQDPAANRVFSIDPSTNGLATHTNADFLAIVDLMAAKQQSYFDAYPSIAAAITAGTIVDQAGINSAIATFVAAWTPPAQVGSLFSSFASINSLMASKADATSMTAALAAKADASSMTTSLDAKADASTVTALATTVAGISTAVGDSAGSLALVGTGATGTQIHATKPSEVLALITLSATSIILTAATSTVTMKKCATNSVTETDWSIAAQATIGSSGVALTQTDTRQLVGKIPAGWFVKLEASGTGTHAETVASTEKVIYG